MESAVDRRNGPQFEISVRHVARQLYRAAYSSGSIIVDGRERDEIIDTGTEIIVIEASTSRKLEKTRYDLDKSKELVKSLRKIARYADHNFRIMLVTQDEPTADQNTFVRESRIGCPKEIISFNALFARLFDARQYSILRGSHFFGSIRDPSDENNIAVPFEDYIPNSLINSATGDNLRADSLYKMIKETGGRYCVFGDYGSGKSMTLRDLYKRSQDSFFSGEVGYCPVYLNLREHIAQNQPDEALYRHAERIGLPNPFNLIGAWRAGFVALYLDGFDELTPPQFAVPITHMRQARRFAVELVQKFIEQTPNRAPIVMAGRENYFDSREEAVQALGIQIKSTIFDLSGFDDDDVSRFLRYKKSDIPSWLPTRPLLLAYLAKSGLITSDDTILSLDPARGWNEILDRVCEREVRQNWGVGFESSNLRTFIERLATNNRKKKHNAGLEQSDIRAAFHDVFGRDADEPACLLAGKLPGLGSIPGRPGAREFVDVDFASAATSGDLARYVNAPFVARSPLRGVVSPISELGQSMVTIAADPITAKLPISLREAGQEPDLCITAADILNLMIEESISYDMNPLVLSDANFEDLVFDESIDFSKIKFSRCIIMKIMILRKEGNASQNNLPVFENCLIEKIEGATSRNDLPGGVLIGDTEVRVFSLYTSTNDAILTSNLPDSVKVLLTILRKLFMQRGSGRQYSAFVRGMPGSLRRHVDPILALVKAHGFTEEVQIDKKTITIPRRTRTSDAYEIINGPNKSQNGLIIDVRNL